MRSDEMSNAFSSSVPTTTRSGYSASFRMSLAVSLLRQRWLLIAHADTSVQPLVIGILVFWLAAIFVSFGINAPRHATMHVVFLILAVGIGSALFLILELNSPFDGPMRISSQPIQMALSHMLPPGR